MSALFAFEWPFSPRVTVALAVAAIVCVTALGWIAWTWKRAGRETDEDREDTYL